MTFTVDNNANEIKEATSLIEKMAIDNDNVTSVQPLEELFTEKEAISATDDKYISACVRLADTQDDMKLYHYVECNDNDTNEIKSCRGIIRVEDEIICKTFGYTQEIESNLLLSVTTSSNTSNEFMGFPIDQCIMYDSEEGATIRLFFHKNKWHMSTHRKINAYRSRWGNHTSRSFGDMFIDALEWETKNGSLKDILKYETRNDLFNCYTDTLNRRKNYTFLIRNSNENRIVCDSLSHPKAFFTGSFDRDNEHLLIINDNDTGFEIPRVHTNFLSIEEVVLYVNNSIDYKLKQGIIVYMPDQTQIKVLNPTYLKYFNTRGNEPSIKFRYLQIRKDKDQVAMLYNLYPDIISKFEIYENIIANLELKIYRGYIDRFVNKKYVSLPQPEYFVIQACHKWHCDDRTNNKISIEKVSSVISDQSPNLLNRMIRPYFIKNKNNNNQQ
jgi:hypothetical protein